MAAGIVGSCHSADSQPHLSAAYRRRPDFSPSPKHLTLTTAVSAGGGIRYRHATQIGGTEAIRRWAARMVDVDGMAAGDYGYRCPNAGQTMLLLSCWEAWGSGVDGKKWGDRMLRGRPPWRWMWPQSNESGYSFDSDIRLVD